MLPAAVRLRQFRLRALLLLSRSTGPLGGGGTYWFTFRASCWRFLACSAGVPLFSRETAAGSGLANPLHLCCARQTPKPLESVAVEPAAALRGGPAAAAASAVFHRCCPAGWLATVMLESRERAFAARSACCKTHRGRCRTA